MRAIDTNVVARFLLNDDTTQSAVAARVIADGVSLPITVLLELGWLLQSRAELDRATLAETFIQLLDLPGIAVAHENRVRWALNRYRDRGDLADLLHIATCDETAESFATFDKGVAGAAGPDCCLSIETLA